MATYIVDSTDTTNKLVQHCNGGGYTRAGSGDTIRIETAVASSGGTALIPAPGVTIDGNGNQITGNFTWNGARSVKPAGLRFVGISQLNGYMEFWGATDLVISGISPTQRMIIDAQSEASRRGFWINSEDAYSATNVYLYDVEVINTGADGFAMTSAINTNGAIIRFFRCVATSNVGLDNSGVDQTWSPHEGGSFQLYACIGHRYGVNQCIAVGGSSWVEIYGGDYLGAILSANIIKAYNGSNPTINGANGGITVVGTNALVQDLRAIGVDVFTFTGDSLLVDRSAIEQSETSTSDLTALGSLSVASEIEFSSCFLGANRRAGKRTVMYRSGAVDLTLHLVNCTLHNSEEVTRLRATNGFNPNSSVWRCLLVDVDTVSDFALDVLTSSPVSSGNNFVDGPLVSSTQWTGMDAALALTPNNIHDATGRFYDPATGVTLAGAGGTGDSMREAMYAMAGPGWAAKSTNSLPERYTVFKPKPNAIIKGICQGGKDLGRRAVRDIGNREYITDDPGCWAVVGEDSTHSRRGSSGRIRR